MSSVCLFSCSGDSEGLTSGGQGAVISAAFVHMRTVSAFSMQHSVSARYNDEVQTISKERQGRSLYFGAGLGFSNATRFLTYALLFWYGAQLILHDGLTFVQLMTAMMSLMLGALGLGQALNEIGKLPSQCLGCMCSEFEWHCSICGQSFRSVQVFVDQFYVCNDNGTDTLYYFVATTPQGTKKKASRLLIASSQ